MKKTSKTNYVSTCKNWLQVIQVLRSPVGSWDFFPNEGCSYWRDFFRKSQMSKTLTELCNAFTSPFIQIGFASFLPVARPQ